jgi:hypothetical protein
MIDPPVASWLLQVCLARLVGTEYPYMRMEVKDPTAAARDTYLAAAMYAFLAIVSVVFWVRGARRVRRSQLAELEYQHTHYRRSVQGAV